MPELQEDLISRKLRRQSLMEQQRSTFETHWQQVAEVCLPRSNIFWQRGNTWLQGQKRTEKQYDSTAELALSRFAAAMISMLVPRNQEWHGLASEDPDIEDDQETHEYLDKLTKLLFRLRNSPLSNYQSEKGEIFTSVGAFGTGIMFVDEDIAHNFRYHACHLSECYIAESHTGQIDTVYRKFMMPARQMAQKWGPNKLPTPIQTALRQAPDTEFEVLHCVEPNGEYDQTRRDYRGMAYSSTYISITGRALLSQGGYRTMPYSVDRYVTGPREVYGRGPGMQCLADNKMLQDMSRTIIQAAHLAVMPPLLLQEDGALQAFAMEPHALNYGGVDEKGNQLVHPLVTNARIDIGLEMQEQRRTSIRDTFLNTLFQVLSQDPPPNMTAYEVAVRAQEKGELLAPTMGRAQEALGVQIAREIDIAFHAGLIQHYVGPMPDSLLKRGGQIKIVYTSPLNQLMMAGRGKGILEAIQTTLLLAQLDPSVTHIIDAEEALREMIPIHGAPLKILRTPEAVQALKDQQSQQAALAQMVQAAPLVGSAAKDLTAAAATGQNVPQPQPVGGG